MFQEPAHIIFIFFSVDGAGAVNQRPARLDVPLHYGEYLPLKAGQIMHFLGRHIVFDIRLPADYAKAGAGEIGNYHIGGLLRIRIKGKGVSYGGP